MTIIRFQPQRYNVKLDGVSDAKLELKLACYDTAASYAASAYQVWAEGGEWPISDEYTGEPVFTWFRGERYFSISGSYANASRTYVSNVSLPVSASTASISISFSGLQNGTASDGEAYLWNLTATKSGSARQLLAGRVDVDAAKAYGSNASSVNIVSAVTAHKCF